jgi:hypothetical protein
MASGGSAPWLCDWHGLGNEIDGIRPLTAAN